MIKCLTVVLTSELFWLGCCSSTPQVSFLNYNLGSLFSRFFWEIFEFNVTDRSEWVYPLRCRNAPNRPPINVLTYCRRAIGSYWPTDNCQSLRGVAYSYSVIFLHRISWWMFLETSCFSSLLLVFLHLLTFSSPVCPSDHVILLRQIRKLVWHCFFEVTCLVGEVS